MFHSQEPSRKAEHLRFEKLNLVPNGKEIGWKSGPHVCLSTHYLGQTKPCIKAITDGKLKCQCELLELRTQFALWMPYYSRDGEKKVVMCGEGMKEQVSRIPFGAPISIRKGKHIKAPYVVREDMWTDVPCPFLRTLKFQHDIKAWLLQMWKLPELIAHFGLAEGKIPITASESDVLERLEDEKVEAYNRLKEFSKGIQELTAESPSPPMLNGKHKKTKPLTGD